MGADTPYQYDAGRDQKQKVGVLGSTARRVTAQVSLVCVAAAAEQSGCEFDAREDTIRRLRARNALGGGTGEALGVGWGGVGCLYSREGGGRRARGLAPISPYTLRGGPL
eukprot:scaffold10077_cov126-Isochrysis_galbana.AAC.1